MTESQRLELIANAVTNANKKVAPQFIEKKAGLAAMARLEELLADNDNRCVIRTSLDKKGKYGRVLGTLYGEYDVNFNEVLVEEGYADEYFGGKK